MMTCGILVMPEWCVPSWASMVQQWPQVGESLDMGHSVCPFGWTVFSAVGQRQVWESVAVMDGDITTALILKMLELFVKV